MHFYGINILLNYACVTCFLRWLFVIVSSLIFWKRLFLLGIVLGVEVIFASFGDLQLYSFSLLLNILWTIPFSNVEQYLS